MFFKGIMPAIVTPLLADEFGDLAGARAAQQKVTRLIAALRAFSTIPAAKAMLEHKGFAAGNAAFPLKQLDETQKERVVQVMGEAGWNNEVFGM